MKANEIRKKFLDYFASKRHKIIKSDSLVPKDKTVLFTTAGMQQFKEQFLGHIDDFTRAATSQKCLRTDDLEEVGVTDFHHTFFEMLGNFSFGDYFKKEAIEWGWEFLTKELEIPEEKLWVSIYKDDKEAEKIWFESIKIPKHKLVKLGDHSNFWPADAKEKGPNGPCGPCSEIFYDFGKNPDCTSKICDPSCDCGRFSEIWNLVFTQFERKDDGELVPLPNKNIDTGMGLERLTALMQGKRNNFESDLFEPITAAIDDLMEKENIKITLKEKRIIADHIRAIVFSIHDGVIPSNKERGYVVKVLINRCATILLDAGATKETVYTLTNSVTDAMQSQYPEVAEKIDEIKKLIKNAETAYIKTRKEKIPMLIEKYNLKKETASDESALAKEIGQLIFEFKDTHGLQLETILSIIKKVCGFSQKDEKIALEEYQRLMNEQKKRSRASSKMAGDVFDTTEMELNVPKTKFFGYERAESTSTILALYIDNEKVPTAEKGTKVKVVLDKTPFYAESGGQVGDSGELLSQSGIIKITDTQKMSDVFIHIGIIESGTFRVNDQVTAKIDLDRRLAIMRNHTATHLLQAALRKIVGRHVQQQGSFVSAQRLRFDFTHQKALSEKELNDIEFLVNKMVVGCDSVTKEYLDAEKAKELGALAFFEDKYGDTVRVVSISNYSKEFCGGTHLDSTGQIGLFKIVSESAIAQGIRRIEATTGLNALTLSKENENRLVRIANSLKSPVSEVVDRVAAQTKKIKELQKDLEKYHFEAMKHSVDLIMSSSQNINGSQIISHYFKDSQMNVLKKVCDFIKSKAKSSVIVLGSKTDETASVVVSVSDDLVKKGIKATDIVKQIAPVMEGRGGGRPQLAQAGSKKTDNIEQVLEEANKIIKESFKK